MADMFVAAAGVSLADEKGVKNLEKKDPMVTSGQGLRADGWWVFELIGGLARGGLVL